jgi:hypothetical protein
MTANKRLTDLTDYVSVLPYASEMFGVYQPLLGWRSKRKVARLRSALRADRLAQVLKLRRQYIGQAALQFNADQQLEAARVGLGHPADAVARDVSEGLLLGQIAVALAGRDAPPRGEEWAQLVNEDQLARMLNGPVFQQVQQLYQRDWRQSHNRGLDTPTLQARAAETLKAESATAGLFFSLVRGGMFDTLEELFFASRPGPALLDVALGALKDGYQNPFLTFDPTKQIGDVSVSPVGIVHLYRQFFFELDSFVGTPVGHVWLSPGSMVELVEVSTRRVMVEKAIETVLETTTKTESSTTQEDEISEAVKQANRDDTKLGFSTTVNQSWGTGNATATGSLNLDKTQETARDQQNKRSRQQVDKLSTEIRQNFKSTFRTVSETIDTSSKRYVLNNATANLINYELKRKMRQVGVQTQDIGSYLCWETFVDQPGDQLGLPNLIHIAKPADLVLVPDPKLMPMPPKTLPLTFSGEAVWNFPDNAKQWNSAHPETKGQFVPITTRDIPGVPADYEVVVDPANPFIDIQKEVVAADDDESWNAVNWLFRGMITADGKRVMAGVVTPPGGLAWDDRITFKISGAVTCQLSAAKEDEINKANDALISAKQAADAENARRVQEAYVNAVKDRVTLASKIEKRKFEDLREEERTIVYRNLIRALVTDTLYFGLPDTPKGRESRHVLSELLNSIFDIEKMLYFVAPEWWKPRRSVTLQTGGAPPSLDRLADSIVSWSDGMAHTGYFITDESKPAALGSSLGWLLQLDGDDLRNAFLNAPWVKTVIPIRPGKEQIAINWLKTVGVEGSEGLDAAYSAPEDELNDIRARLLAADPADPVAGHAAVTIDDAIRLLCKDVAAKHALSSTVGRYPEDEIDDSNRVSATPIEKVYEHGFYPLQGGFKAKTERPFEVFSQWIEVLPTDQVVPVEVAYNPKTGRQV